MPDTGSDLILGLVVVFGFLGIYLASLVVRYRNIEKEKHLIEQLQSEQ